MEFSFSDIDWRSLLLKRYKGYGLSESDVMVVFIADQIEKVDPTAPITAETVAGYMTLSVDEVDQALERLLSRKFISYTVDNMQAKLSLEGLFNRLFSDLQKDIVLKRDDGGRKMSEIHEYLVKELNRPSLSPIELDKVAAMVSEGATLKLIKQAVSNIRSKGSNLTFSRLSKEVLRLEKEDDISREGYTVRNDIIRDDRKLNETLAHDWVNDDDDDEGDYD